MLILTLKRSQWLNSHGRYDNHTYTLARTLSCITRTHALALALAYTYAYAYAYAHTFAYTFFL